MLEQGHETGREELRHGRRTGAGRGSSPSLSPSGSLPVANRRQPGRWAVVAAAVVLMTVVVLSGTDPAGAATSRTGPGKVVTSGTASGSGETVQMLYTAAAPGLSGGAISVTIPRGWSAPQKRSAFRAGYVTTTKGHLRISQRVVRVTTLNLCTGCSVKVTYTSARTPRSGRSVFLTRSASAAGQTGRPLAVQPTLSTTVTGSGAAPLGDYAGFADPGGIASFGRATGTRPSFALDYLDSTDGWSAMDGADGVQAWKGSGYRLVLGVPIIPTDSGGNPQGTLAEGAAGAYNGYFSTLAQSLVRQGLSDAILRLGWEFNGSWFAWSVGNASDAADYAAYWRQIVTTMRSVSGERFQFFWNPNALSPTSYSPDQAYPGNAYVDYVGTDAYDNFWGTPFTPQAAWANQLSEQWGLTWLASFAAAHGRAIAIGEWSVSYRDDGHGLGDDPYYVDRMAGWIAANRVAFTDVFSYDTSSELDDLLDGSFPNALTEFEKDFGG